MRPAIAVIVALLVAFLVTPFVLAQVDVSLPVPLPPDLRIVQPGPDIPAERAAFSGIWTGKWDNVLDTALAVDEISASRVSAIYAWGVAPAWNIQRAGWVRARRAEFVGSDLRVTTDLFPINYRMRPDGRIDGTLLGQQQSRAIFTRAYPRTVTGAPPSPAAQPATPPSGSDCVVEQITFNSGLLRLKGTVMRPKADGRFPVVIFNHGSRFQFQGASVVSFEADPIVPAGTACPGLVAEKKWILFVPWRRGYGGSEGDRYSDLFTRFSGADAADAAVRRLQGVEADDANAGYEYIKSLGVADTTKVAMTGASLGGIVSMFSAAKNPAAYRAVVDQAGAWGVDYESLVEALIRSGRSIDSPILLQHGTQDQVAALTVSRRVADELTRLGKKILLRTYPIGHSFNIFNQGEIWLPDFMKFLEDAFK